MVLQIITKLVAAHRPAFDAAFNHRPKHTKIVNRVTYDNGGGWGSVEAMQSQLMRRYSQSTVETCEPINNGVRVYETRMGAWGMRRVQEITLTDGSINVNELPYG